MHGVATLYKEIKMKMWKRVSLCIFAWLVCHFALHIGFTVVTNNPPNGWIALISMCVAGAVFYLTRAA